MEFGEVGLAGELRSVSNVDSRISEAEKLGFSTVILPKQCIKQLPKRQRAIKLVGVSTVGEAFAVVKNGGASAENK